MVFDPAPFQTAARTMGRGVKPIFEVGEGGGKVQVGTAFALADASKRLVVTAHHVVKGPLAKGMAFSMAGSAMWPPKYGMLEPVDGYEFDLDVAFAVAEVDPAEDSALAYAIPNTQVITGVPTGPGVSFIAIGFPESKARFRDAQKRLTNKLMYVSVQSEPLDVYEKLGLDPRVHIAAKYDRSARVDLLEAPVIGSDPHGMSGGVLALASERVLPSGEHQVELYVAGVLTQYHKEPQNTLVATRIDCLLDAVAPFRPDAEKMCRGVDV